MAGPFRAYTPLQEHRAPATRARGACLLGYLWKGLGLDWAVLAGYRALGQDYSTGSGRPRFQWDTVMRGPIVGLSIRF